MTKENLTSINVIIDASGSMQGLTKDTIGSFNTFLDEQKAVPGEAMFTLCTFNTDYRLLHDCAILAGVPGLDAKTYRPNGGTALYDAIGTTITSVGQKLAAMAEEDRPSKVIFLIMTDGEENMSRRYTYDQIKEMVAHQSDKYSWEFVFMGANIDSMKTGTSLSVSAANTMNYDFSPAGTKEVYKTASSNLRSYRLQSKQKVDFFKQDQSAPATLPATVTTTTTTTVATPVVPSKDTTTKS